MRTSLAGFIALLLACSLGPAATAAATEAARPPDGTYSYQVRRGGAVLATASIVISSKSPGVIADERTVSPKLTADSKTTFDPGTFAERAYSADLTDAGGTEHITATLNDGVATVDAGSRHLTMQALPGAAVLVVVDNLVCSNVVLPAIAKGTGSTAVTLVLLETGKTALAKLGATADAPPLTAQARDAGMTLSLGAVAGTIWYDPATLVVDEIDFPAQNESIRLLKRT